MRISDWSSDVCSSDLYSRLDSTARRRRATACGPVYRRWHPRRARKLMVVSTLAAWPEKLSADLIIRATCRWSRAQCRGLTCIAAPCRVDDYEIEMPRSEEHTSELQSLMRSLYAVFCLKQKKH